MHTHGSANAQPALALDHELIGWFPSVSQQMADLCRGTLGLGQQVQCCCLEPAEGGPAWGGYGGLPSRRISSGGSPGMLEERLLGAGEGGKWQGAKDAMALVCFRKVARKAERPFPFPFSIFFSLLQWSLVQLVLQLNHILGSQALASWRGTCTTIVSMRNSFSIPNR